MQKPIMINAVDLGEVFGIYLDCQSTQRNGPEAVDFGTKAMTLGALGVLV